MKILTITALGLAAIAVSGCAMTTAGVKKGDERNFVRSMNDVSAGRAIKARMRRAEGFKLGDVDVEVAEGIVLLSGDAPRPEDRIEAERIAWSAPNIIQVGNEIGLSNGEGIITGTKDAFIMQSVRTRLIAEGDVKARNINLEVHDGTVYMLGVARDKEELELATKIVSTTRGVDEVVSYMTVHGDNVGGSYASMSEPTSMAAMPYSGDTYGSAPATGALPDSQPMQRALPEALSSSPVPRDPDALGDGEPYYVDPETGQRIELPEGVKPIPYVPDAPGSLGAGAKPPPGIAPGEPLPSGPTAPAQLTDLGDDIGKAFPSDEELGAYRSGRPGEAVSVIESAPYYVDPDTGMEIPVRWNGETYELVR